MRIFFLIIILFMFYLHYNFNITIVNLKIILSTVEKLIFTNMHIEQLS